MDASVMFPRKMREDDAIGSYIETSKPLEGYNVPGGEVWSSADVYRPLGGHGGQAHGMTMCLIGDTCTVLTKVQHDQLSRPTSNRELICAMLRRFAPVSTRTRSICTLTQRCTHADGPQKTNPHEPGSDVAEHGEL
jgi:hypothetical protein